MHGEEPSRLVAQALLALVMAGSLDATTNVAVDLDVIAATTGLPIAIVEREVEALVGAGAGDWV